ncbi:MAG: saccharopine dehydrogenase NADP-binding domain-containing protein [Microlunatus sp.]|nr:saccharopine dehydrogenase NADP-binding domain-containing protein [Microlunatus sp.]MDN5771659.1 saccharopine dehydrogenase NADP-binding domain-containing protein [Microlunatus sp.]
MGESTMGETASREFDLVLVGATGFVGRLTARHLAEHASSGLRVGLAGRSADRLEKVRSSLPAAGSTWPLITIDVLDDTAVANLAARSRVVASTVGPYLRYGLALVQACARAGTHYADLTGETLFVRRSIDAAHESARASGARIVHSCGFDSVPSDLGVGLAASRAAAEDAGQLTSAVLHVRKLRGGISGGTVDSLRQQMIEARTDPVARRLAGDPRALADDVSGSLYGSSSNTDGPSWLARDDQTKSWQTPFVMGSYNRQIVHRSNAIAGWPYGREFGYGEVVATGRGPRGAVIAAGIAVGTGALMAGMSFGPTRNLLDRVLPKPGQGPNDRTRSNGTFTVAVDADTVSGARYRTTIAADHDPGYDATAVMLGESAIALASETDLGAAGVVTPMVALGSSLPQRLRDRGFTVVTERLCLLPSREKPVGPWPR